MVKSKYNKKSIDNSNKLKLGLNGYMVFALIVIVCLGNETFSRSYIWAGKMSIFTLTYALLYISGRLALRKQRIDIFYMILSLVTTYISLGSYVIFNVIIINKYNIWFLFSMVFTILISIITFIFSLRSKHENLTKKQLGLIEKKKMNLEYFYGPIGILTYVVTPRAYRDSVFILLQTIIFPMFAIYLEYTAIILYLKYKNMKNNIAVKQ